MKPDNQKTCLAGLILSFAAVASPMAGCAADRNMRREGYQAAIAQKTDDLLIATGLKEEPQKPLYERAWDGVFNLFMQPD